MVKAMKGERGGSSLSCRAASSFGGGRQVGRQTGRRGPGVVVPVLHGLSVPNDQTSEWTGFALLFTRCG